MAKRASASERDLKALEDTLVERAKLASVNETLDDTLVEEAKRMSRVDAAVPPSVEEDGELQAVLSASRAAAAATPNDLEATLEASRRERQRAEEAELAAVLAVRTTCCAHHPPSWRDVLEILPVRSARSLTLCMCVCVCWFSVPVHGRHLEMTCLLTHSIQ